MKSLHARGAQDAKGLFQTKYGSFEQDGLSYVIRRPDTPRPWINIICNGSYGLQVSQNGGGYSWWENANLARLTSWSQDLIRDESGKFLYVRDDDSGNVWSASWKPVCASYEYYGVRHAIGSTTFIQRNADIETRWSLAVPSDRPLEVWHVQVRNLGSRPRHISLFSYLEWCLGNGTEWHREFQKTFIETSFDSDLGSLMGVKRRLEMPPHISSGLTEWPLSGFHTVNRPAASYEGDKEHFLGRYGQLSKPEAVVKGELSNTTGRWYDPIASLHVKLKLKPNGSEDVVFLVGKHDSRKKTSAMIKSYGAAKGAKKALDGAKGLWQPFIDRLRVETPDEAFNLMTNVWLKYQAIGCRIWARTAYYQSSAAYGYRDQLQDSHVFLPLEPGLTKKQILLHASRQYQDGGVEHWWLPLIDKGPRSGQTDTPLWLVYVTLSYLDETYDLSILRESVPFRDGKASSLFDHCTRSLSLSLVRFSKRGLPLIGEGDWNDAFSSVGSLWKGESIWLGHFLYDVLLRWSSVCDLLRARPKGYLSIGVKQATLGAMAQRYRRRAAALKKAINRHGWDGKWYWRATRDDGRVIGSRKNKEGRIFLNAQSWSVIAGTATPLRAKQAMASVERYLNRQYGPLLLTPAYTKPDGSIGYLSRYAPGTRENGGVYSHAAVWAIMAECMMGNGDAAFSMYTKLCPAIRGMDAELYCAEPYVMPGNSDGPESPYFGRAGWSWYTGSAAWLFRVSTEWILGVRPRREGLLVDPCIPSRWDGFNIIRNYRGSTFRISVENPNHVARGVAGMWLDGKPLTGSLLPDLRDGGVHQVRVVLGAY